MQADLFNPFSSVEHATIWLLVLFSILTWAIALMKGVQFGQLKNEDKRFRRDFWEARNLEEAILKTADQPGPTARMARAGFKAIQVKQSKQPDLTQAINRQDRLERALRQQIQRERRTQESALAILASVGSTSPFIGLFGTVWGIMEALKGISLSGSASLETVAGPIGASLIATGVGIAAAVPAVLVYNYFLRRLKSNAADLDDFAHDFYALAQQSAFQLQEPVAQSRSAVKEVS
ncbi:MotA/TolQ/ExbB proton channel family protein [Pseudomonas putida]|uniref:MotA/TolQ/ExbB proton channel family protein n=1 Tax=Pseudomonas putida TaxID=303 RepID=UPI0009A23FAA|nr:MotA/TolQ/ExbB proton channel family protein [Pseudomonas putida]